MKKVLFASTALVMSAGFAAAEVTVSGDARMGLVYDDTAVNKITNSSRVRIAFTASGETDGGLTWGATVRNSQTAAVGDVSLGGAFGTIKMGSPTGADSVANVLADVGYTGIGIDNQVEGNSASSIGGHNVSYSTSVSGFSFGISGDMNNSDVAVGIGYSMDGMSIGLGYDAQGNDSTMTLGVSYAMDAVTVAAMYSQDEVAGVTTNAYGISMAYDTGSGTVTVAMSDSGAAVDSQAFGIGYSMGLGGGATLAVGAGKVGAATRAQAGISFSF